MKYKHFFSLRIDSWRQPFCQQRVLDPLTSGTAREPLILADLHYVWKRQRLEKGLLPVAKVSRLHQPFCPSLAFCRALCGIAALHFDGPGILICPQCRSL